MESRFSDLASVWGAVSYVGQVSGHPGFVQIVVAGQDLMVQRTTDHELEKLGLLQLSKKGNRVFLVFFTDKKRKRDFIMAGWKNPPDLLVRQIQALVTVEADSLHKEIATANPRPDWKDFDYRGDGTGDEESFKGNRGCDA